MLSSVATYIQAKDENRPELMTGAFATDAILEMVVNTDAIAFPPFTQGVSSITDVLVTRFNEKVESVRTFCLAPQPKAEVAALSCAWLVGMSEKGSGTVRVGCGRYDWTFQAQKPHLAKHLKIAIEVMEILPAQHWVAVMEWLSKLPYPWCDSRVAARYAPNLKGLEPIVRYLKQLESEVV